MEHNKEGKTFFEPVREGPGTRLRTRCDTEENVHQMGQQASEEGEFPKQSFFYSSLSEISWDTGPFLFRISDWNALQLGYLA
ncbi:hypothetical protein CEXT_407011 [Caerostris extrusa]|uniref:Uncharacterized protein n=1 Tax=Caerostris extrusa TaxID=172846 RepID=A0AAV4XWP7_CAEEX|nr:hypothetical protein CEXT_407011 [Caerostris extrusa]